MKIPLQNGISQRFARGVSLEDCTNCYPERVTDEVSFVRGFPGLYFHSTGTSTDNPLRFLGLSGDGTKVRSCNGDQPNYMSVATGSSTWSDCTGSTLTTSSGELKYATNGTSDLFVDGSNYYWTTSSGTVVSTETQIEQASPDVWTQNTTTQTPKYLDYIDGYFIVADSSNFYISELNADLSSEFNSNGPEFGTPIRDPDGIMNIAVINRELWILGKRTTEVWYNSGDADFPFAPIGGGFSEWGCAASNTVAKTNENILWVGANKYGDSTVQASKGYSSITVSTPAVEELIRKESRISQAYARTCYFDGTWFYMLHLPDSNQVLVLNLNNLQWFKLTGKEQYIGNHFLYVPPSDYAQSRVLVSHKTENSALILKNDVYTDEGYPKKIEKIFSPVQSESKRIFGDSLEIDIDTGVGFIRTLPVVSITFSGTTATCTTEFSHQLQNQQQVTITGATETEYNGTFTISVTSPTTFTYTMSGTPSANVPTSDYIILEDKRAEDPEIQLYWTDDGGETWNGPRTKRLGKAGETKKRIIFKKLGVFSDRTFKIVCDAPVKFALSGAYLDGRISKRNY